MHQLRLYMALRDQSFERLISATAHAEGYVMEPVSLDAVANDMRRYDTLFVVEESYLSILDLIEFHNSCLFNFLPTIVVTGGVSSSQWLGTVRFPYKYFPVDRGSLPFFLRCIAKMLDEMRRAKFQEYLLRHHAAIVAPFTSKGADFTGALAAALRPMLDLLFAEKGSIMLLNRYGNLVVEAATRKELVGREIPYDHASPAWSVLESGEPLFCEDIAKYPRFAKKANAYSKDHFLIVPIKPHEKTIGVFNLADKTVSLLFDRGDLIRARGLLKLIEPILMARCGLLAVR